MNRKIIQYALTIFASLAVWYPLWMRYDGMVWSANIDTILVNLFPGLGLLAFSILWLHLIAGVFEPWLRRYFDFEKFIHYTSIIILISFVLHPLLLFILIDFNFEQLLSGNAKYIKLGMVGWFFLIVYDLGKLLKRKYEFFAKNWFNIVSISTIGFVLIFFHSLYLGSDLQADPLRTVWLIYGITGIAAIVYTYIIKRILLKNT